MAVSKMKDIKDLEMRIREVRRKAGRFGIHDSRRIKALASATEAEDFLHLSQGKIARAERELDAHVDSADDQMRLTQTVVRG